MPRGGYLRTLAGACLLTSLLAASAWAQGLVTAIGFRNDLPSPVIVQGVSQINGMVRRGQPTLVPASRRGIDFNVPPGRRLYNVYDAKQPRVLAKDVPVNVPLGRNISFVIRALPTGQVLLVPE